MAGEGRPTTTLLRRMKKRRGWPAFAGHDTGGAVRVAVCHSFGRLVLYQPPETLTLEGIPNRA